MLVAWPLLKPLTIAKLICFSSVIISWSAVAITRVKVKILAFRKFLNFFLPKKAFYGLTSIFCEGLKKSQKFAKKKFLEFSPK